MFSLGRAPKPGKNGSLLLATALIILVATWSVGIGSRVAMSRWVPVHVVQLPTLSKRLYPWTASRRWTVMPWTYPISVGSNDTLIVQASKPDEHRLVRFDLRRHRWLPGFLGGSGGAPAPNGLACADSSGTVLCLRGFHQIATGAAGIGTLGRRAGVVNGVRDLVGRSGAGYWFAGMKVAVCSQLANSHAARGSGQVTLATLNAVAHNGLRTHFVSVPYPVSSDPCRSSLPLLVPAPDGSVWLADGAGRYCFQGRCYYGWLIRYDPRTRRFRRYLVPRTIYAGPAGPNLYWAGLAVAGVGPDGTVWAWASSGRSRWLVAFHHGIFQAFQNPFFAAPRGWPAQPLIDRNGDIWFCQGAGETPVVYSPSNNSTTALDLSGGTILQATNGEMWYVRQLRQPPIPCGAGGLQFPVLKR